MLIPSMLIGNVFNLFVINPPKFLVLDPLDTLNLCLRHGQLEICLQPVPLISPLSKILDHDPFIACQQFNRVLPKIREVVCLSLVDDLRNLNLDLVVLEADDLEVLARLSRDINEVAIAKVLLLNLILDLCKELIADGLPTDLRDVGVKVPRVTCIVSDFLQKSCDLISEANDTEARCAWLSLKSSAAETSAATHLHHLATAASWDLLLMSLR
jgi:hypothetical protein